MSRITWLTILVLAVSGLFLACGGGDDDEEVENATPTEEPAATTAAATSTRTAPATGTPEATEAEEIDIAVTLREFEVATDISSGSAGNYRFSISNAGPDESHVFMIVPTDLPADMLPVSSTGQFAPNDDAYILANTPGISAGGTDAFVHALEAGNYVFICNNVSPGISEGAGQGHYSQGMYTAFTVE